MPEAKDVSGASQEHLKCVNKVVGYPMVASLLTNVQTYYQSAKQSYKVVNYLESSVTSSYQWLAPKVVEPVLQNETFKKYSEPLIASLDNFSCRQLDNLEKLEKDLETKVTTLKKTTNSLAEIGQEKIAVPIDSYLKESMLGAPLNKILDATETVADKYLIGADVKTAKQEETQTPQTSAVQKYDGPVFKATRISKKVQRQAFLKLKDLSLRTPERLKSMVHTVDLIQYAANALDYGVKTTNQFLEQSVYKGVDSTMAILPKMNIKNVREKMGTAVHDSILALQVAASSLSVGNITHLPVRMVEKAIQWEDREIKRFSVLAQKSSATLKEIIASISEHLGRKESVPQQLIVNATTKINQIIDNLVSLYKTALQKGEAKMEEFKKGEGGSK
jgi:hypothetical protein